MEPGRDRTLRQALRRALPDAMKRGDEVAIAAIRSALSALDNAEAVTPPETPAAHPFGAPGLGAGEAPRRVLDATEVEAIARAEIADRRTAAAEYRGLGRPDRADRLDAEADVLERIVWGAG